MKWIPCNERMPLDNNVKIIFCTPKKGYKQQETERIFTACYCVCSGWSEAVSNHEMNGEQRRYWDHLHKYEVTHWAEMQEPS